MSGTLYVVATPIGNLEDISKRAVDTLRKVAWIACEDTRVTAKLMTRLGIRARKVSYHEHNERRRALELVKRLEAGEDIALVSDAGTPGISDPGYRLVREARRRGLRVLSVPGPSAVVAALAVSGLPTSSFCFLGFLPARTGARRKAINALSGNPHTLVLFESARRAPGLLKDLAERWGPREAFVAREMTKLHEEHRYGTLQELAAWAAKRPLRGELTLVIAPGDEANRGCVKEVEEQKSRLKRMRHHGLSPRQAAKQIARELGRSSRDVYREIAESEPLKPGAEETK